MEYKLWTECELMLLNDAIHSIVEEEDFENKEKCRKLHSP